MLRRSVGIVVGAVICFFIFIPVCAALLARLTFHDAFRAHVWGMMLLAEIGGGLLAGVCTAMLVWVISRRPWDSLPACAVAAVALSGYAARTYGTGLMLRWDWLSLLAAVVAGAGLAALWLERRAKRGQTGIGPAAPDAQQAQGLPADSPES